jgi:Bacterial regulatory protein, arsR family
MVSWGPVGSFHLRMRANPAELADRFGTTRANLSNHLTCLRECGLVATTAEGRRIRYELADPRLADALQILARLDLPGHCDTERSDDAYALRLPRVPLRPGLPVHVRLSLLLGPALIRLKSGPREAPMGFSGPASIGSAPPTATRLN